MNLLAMLASMALPLIRRKSPSEPQLPYRSSHDIAARARRHEDQHLMGQRFPLM
jgi:hypothetical protein